MDIPTYLSSPDYAQQETFMQQMFQTLLEGLSDNGWTVPVLTQAQIVAISANMPDGTLWYCSDSVPPTFVGKSAGSLVQFTTTPFP